MQDNSIIRVWGWPLSSTIACGLGEGWEEQMGAAMAYLAIHSAASRPKCGLIESMSSYKYTWKHDISILSKRSLDFPQPLVSGMIFVDLMNGKAYRVHSVHKAKEHDKFIAQMPDDVV